MSKIVQEAGLVLIAASDKYQASDNCQLEANYTKHLGKNTIMLTMDSTISSSPGWLNTRLSESDASYMFNSSADFDATLTALVSAIGSTGKGSRLPTKTKSVPRSSPNNARLMDLEKKQQEHSRVLSAHGRQLSAQQQTIDVHGASISMQQQVLEDQRRFIDLQQRTLVEQRDMIDESKRAINAQNARIVVLEGRNRRCIIS